eukprot:TRINITY_DN3792_c0_g1_i10.p1 TRINITY_DN3792_c0_g1~~TRINITY_DN3792_c0_g1_i10.p1  ORF type:complete len:352 (-),score=53.72 TRINITY_DN3792_c0_g1_i10:68-1123(-)
MNNMEPYANQHFMHMAGAGGAGGAGNMQTQARPPHPGNEIRAPFKRAATHVAIAYFIYLRSFESNGEANKTDVTCKDPTYNARRLREKKLSQKNELAQLRMEAEQSEGAPNEQERKESNHGSDHESERANQSGDQPHDSEQSHKEDKTEMETEKLQTENTEPNQEEEIKRQPVEAEIINEKDKEHNKEKITDLGTVHTEQKSVPEEKKDVGEGMAIEKEGDVGNPNAANTAGVIQIFGNVQPQTSTVSDGLSTTASVQGQNIHDLGDKDLKDEVIKEGLAVTLGKIKKKSISEPEPPNAEMRDEEMKKPEEPKKVQSHPSIVSPSNHRRRDEHPQPHACLLYTSPSPRDQA